MPELRARVRPADGGERAAEQEQGDEGERVILDATQPSITRNEGSLIAAESRIVLIVLQSHCQVVDVPAEAGIVEIDDVQPLAVDDHVAGVQVRMNQAVAA